VALSLLLCASLAGAQGAVTLLDTDVSTAVTAQLSPVMPLARLAQESQKYILAQAKFSGYGAGGTNVTAYLQTSLDAGVTWIDVMSFQFTTANATKVSKVGLATALAAAVTPGDGALTVNTILDGVIGDRLRVKYTTTGTYTGTYASTTIGYVDITDVSPGVFASQTVVYQNGTNVIPTAQATNTVVYVNITDMSATKVLNIQGVVYTFVAIVALPGDVKIAGTADGTMLNLSRAINKVGGTEGVGQDYMSVGGLAHPYVTASLNAGTDTLTLTSILPGVVGNGYALSTPPPSAEPTFTLGGALFANGTNTMRLTVNGVAYNFVATVAVAGDVKIGANSDATMLNLQRCINKNGGVEGAGQDYMTAGGIANPLVSAANNSVTDTLTLSARSLGLAGNAYTLTSPSPYTEPTFTLGGALLVNGEESRRVVVNGVVYTFVATVAVAGDVKIGGSADATMLNLARCINKSGGTEGANQDYMSAGGAINPYVAAAQTAGSDIVTLTARTSGVGGNSYTLSSPAPYTETTFTLGTFSGGSASLPHLKVSALVR